MEQLNDENYGLIDSEHLLSIKMTAFLYYQDISDSFVRNAPATENFGGEDEVSGNIVGNVINDAICETSYAVDYKNIALSDKWLTFVDSAPALKVFAGDTPVITQKVTPVLDKGVVSWEAQSQAAYYLYKIDDGEAVRTENLFIDLNKLSLGQTGKYTLYIMVCNDDYAKGEWASIGFEVYSFTVMSEGSQAYEVFAVEGTEIQIRDYPVEKEGHTWVGLQDQDGNAYDINSKYVLIKSSTLSAQWSINQYKITFYTRTAQGEWKEISTEEKDYNTEIVFPTPKVEGWENSGYQFAGWYLDEFLSDSNNYTNIPAKHLELYAKFECKKFDLIAETNNGENAETAKVPYMTNVDESYLNSCFGNVKKFGYSFVGWFLDEKFETPFNPFKMGTSTVTIYAKWSLNTYSVTVETDGGDYEGEIPTSFTVEDGEIELPTAEKYGYTFHGWSVNGHESPISIFICNQYDENVVLKAMFVANKHEATFDYAEGHQQYKITFDSNGRNIHFNSVYVSESQLTVDLPEEKTINYIYNGWYYDSACTQPFKEGDIITADTTLYLDAYEVPAEIRSAYSKISANSALGALRSLTSSTFEGTSYSKSFKWLAVSEDITYGVNVSTWWRKTSSAPSLSVKLYVIDNGQKILSRTFSTKTGNIVDGSGTIGKSIRVSDSIHLEKGSIYLLEISATGSVSYPLQEGSISIGSRALAIEDVNISFLGEKKSITFDEKLGALPTPQRFGYTFGGWLFNDEVVTSETVVKYDGNMPLKAKWIPIVAEVEYVLNDGINHQDNPNSYTIEDGNIRLLPAEKEGYRFMGWYLDEQFTTRISEFSYAEYQQGITLYARFEKLYTVTYVLPDYANTKEPDTRIETEKFYLDSLGDIIGGAQEYRFIGWYTDPEFLNPISFIEEGTQDCFVYAKFLPYYKVIVHLDGGTLQGQFAKFTQEDSFTFTDITATKANYYFDGWYSDKTYTQRLDGIEKGTMQNVDVYAKFVKCTDGLKFTLNSEKTGYIVSAENSMLGETDVTIPELYLGKPVVSVGSFENQTNITSVYIPDSVNSIADYAFRNCNGLQNFVIPETVDSIGEGIFSGCGNLNNLTIPFVGKTEQDEIPFGVLFGKQAFNGAVKIDQQHYENGEKVYAQYYVPISLNFITVNRGNISNYAFSNCENIQSVILGLNVSQIDEWAFYRCSSLEEVELANISIIGDNAFNGLSAIKQIDLPESLIAIGSGAFSGCSGLESIVFLKNLTSIGANAFARCQNLKTIEVPNNVTSIGNGAFSFCSNLTSITLPFVGENADGSGATHFGFIFGASTYNDNNKYVPTKLKNVIIENTTSISQYAFYQCNNITNLTLPFVGENADGSGATHFGFIFGASSYTGNYSLVPSSLDCVTITGGNKIAEKAFYACTNLTEIIFDKNVELTEIGINAFYACSSLISFEIPRGITELNSIFALCESLERVTFADGNQVTTIGDGAFAGLKNLTVIEIPSSVTTIGANAFGNCSQLSGVYISDIKAWCKIDFQGAYANPLSFGHNLYLNEVMLENLILPQDVETISKFAFFSCTSLKNLSLEANSKLTFIGNRAFSSCSNLTNVNLSSSNVEILEEGLFFDCVSLKTVVFGQNNQLKVFNQYLFSGCSNLLSVEIPDSVATIEDSVFSGCNSLQSLKIPAQVTSIKAAFYGCSGLESIIVADENTVYYSSNNCLIHVETKTLVLGCKNSIIPDDGSVTAIGDMAFISCSGLNNINIPDSITSIKARAFEGCTGLTNITFGENSKLSIIGDRAFYGCGKLTDIVIPVNVSSIGANAFKSCNILKNVYYGGADEQWSTISIDSSNSELKTANIYYYSFEQPTSAGNYWHYVEGIPTIWVTE